MEKESRQKRRKGLGRYKRGEEQKGGVKGRLRKAGKRHQGSEKKQSSLREGKRGKRSKWERREEGKCSRLVFQLITTEGPGAAVRNIFFTNDFFYLLQTLINSEPCHLVLHGWAL